MSEFVTQIQFMEEMKELRQEAKVDRHDFVNTIQAMLSKSDDKLEKIIDNHVKIEIIENDLKIIKTNYNDMKDTVDAMSKKMLIGMWFIWAVSGIGGFVAQIFF